MNIQALADLIDGVSDSLPLPLGVGGMIDKVDLIDEVNRLRDENQRLRDALEIIEHTLATLKRK